MLQEPPNMWSCSNAMYYWGNLRIPPLNWVISDDRMLIQAGPCSAILDMQPIPPNMQHLFLSAIAIVSDARSESPKNIPHCRIDPGSIWTMEKQILAKIDYSSFRF